MKKNTTRAEVNVHVQCTKRRNMKKCEHYEKVIYLYDSEEEGDSHSEEMQKQGFEDSRRYGIAIRNPENGECEFEIYGVYIKSYD